MYADLRQNTFLDDLRTETVPLSDNARSRSVKEGIQKRNLKNKWRSGKGIRQR